MQCKKTKKEKCSKGDNTDKHRGKDNGNSVTDGGGEKKRRMEENRKK